VSTNNARLFLIGFLLASIAGCATLARVLTPGAQPFEQAAVFAAVGVAVQQGTTDRAVWTARAARIKAVALQLEALDTGSTAVLSLLEQALNKKIVALNLPPADLLAAQTLTAAITAVVQTELASASNGVLTPQSVVALNDVLTWVTTAASAYGA
jgi:hypothetical protein